MITQGVITRINTPTEWVSSLTYVRKKSGKIRLCLDPKDLNKAICRPHHVSKTLDEIHLLCGASVFSKLDARSGYWSVPLDHDSSILTTFNTHLGRFRFKRLPFGLNLAQDVFQKHMDTMLTNLTGIINIADDIIVYGKNTQLHDENMIALFNGAREYGLVFNIDKCEISVNEIAFFGLIYSSSGIKHDPQRCTAIANIHTPTNVSAVRISGIATYMSPFTANMTGLLAPLRELIHKNTIFEWTNSHQECFKKIKEELCKDSTLVYFDTRLPSTVQVDASGIGLGAVLLQNNRPVCYASRTLTETERRYANIERELLAIVFGCERFHHYLFGAKFTVESDHKPLEMIILKHIATAPARLQRMLLRLQKYQLTIKYKPGKEIALADTLSRDSSFTKNTTIPLTINLINLTLQTEILLLLSKQDDNIQHRLSNYILLGWPSDRSHLPKELHAYWSLRDSLTVDRGLIIEGLSALVPTSAISKTIAKLHMAHIGVEKILLLARDAVYWPTMWKDLTEYVQSCVQCQKHGRQGWLPPPTDREIPSKPWEILATDLFQLKGKVYLLIVDMFSKYPKVHPLPGSTSCETIIQKFKDTFSLFNAPTTLYTDNGPQFSAPLFSTFATEWEFNHKTSSPHYPQSNGFIERQVQTIKNIMTKSSGTDFRKALLSWRNTPIDSTSLSPMQLLLHQSTTQNRKQHINLQLRQSIQHKQQSHHRRTLQPTILHSQQNIIVRDPITYKWLPATIMKRREEPHAYDVTSPYGGIVRRSQHHIKASPPLNIPNPAQIATPVYPIMQPYQPIHQRLCPVHSVHNEVIVSGTHPIDTLHHKRNICLKYTCQKHH